MLSGETFVMGGSGVSQERGDDLFVEAPTPAEISAMTDLFTEMRNAMPFLIDDVRALRWGDPRVSVCDATIERLTALSAAVAAPPWVAVEIEAPVDGVSNWIQGVEVVPVGYQIKLTTYGGSAPFATSQFIAAARNGLPALLDEIASRRPRD